MKKEINDTFKHHLTIEIRENKIVQIAGKNNLFPTYQDMRIIEEWAKKSKISLPLDL